MFCIDDTKDSDATNKTEKTTSATITDNMVKRLYAIGNKAGVAPGDIIKVIKKEYNKIKVEELTKEEYETICKRLESKTK